MNRTRNFPPLTQNAVFVAFAVFALVWIALLFASHFSTLVALPGILAIAFLGFVLMER